MFNTIQLKIDIFLCLFTESCFLPHFVLTQMLRSGSQQHPVVSNNMFLTKEKGVA